MSLVVLAARNNAAWCDAVCGGGEITESHWLVRTQAPPLYPNLVTVAPAVEPALAAIGELERVLPRVPWAVKDSFATLPLAGAGFRLLFEAEWVSRPAADSDMPHGWTRLASDADLTAWSEVAFPPALLRRDDIAFLARRDASGAIASGAVANHAAGVVGLTNVFGSGASRGGVDAAMHVFPAVPLVGYERGDALAEARAGGFASLGRLRVWLKDV